MSRFGKKPLRENLHTEANDRYNELVRRYAESVKDYISEHKGESDVEELAYNGMWDEIDNQLYWYDDQWSVMIANITPQDCGEAFQKALDYFVEDVLKEIDFDEFEDEEDEDYDESYKPVRRPHKRMREARNLSEAKKYTQSDIKELIRKGAATDITNWSDEQITELRRKHSIELVGTSLGVYGPNAGLYRDVDTGELYAVRARNTVLGMMPIR